MKRTALALLLAIGIIVIAGGIAYYALHHSARKTAVAPEESDAAPAAPIASSTPTATDWKIYSIPKYHYQIHYPPSWPATLSGNVLTLGALGTQEEACYITITFDTSSTPGTLFANPHTYNYSLTGAEAETCATILSMIGNTSKIVSP